MREIKLTQGRTAIIDDEDFERVSKIKWYFNGHYARNSRAKVKLMHRFVMNAGDYNGDNPVDHINGDGLDNRKINLRICTRSENTYNSKSENTEHTYVYKNIYTSGFRVVIDFDKTYAFLGHTKDIQQAIELRNNFIKNIKDGIFSFLML